MLHAPVDVVAPRRAPTAATKRAEVLDHARAGSRGTRGNHGASPKSSTKRGSRSSSLDCHADHSRVGRVAHEREAQPAVRRARISSRSAGRGRRSRRPAAQRCMSCTVSAGDGSGQRRVLERRRAGSRPAPASSHSTRRAARLRVGQEQHALLAAARPCAGARAARTALRARDGGVRREHRPDARRPRGRGCELLVIVTIAAGGLHTARMPIDSGRPCGWSSRRGRLARPRGRLRPQRDEPVLRDPAAARLHRRRSPRSPPTRPTRAASPSRSGSWTSTRGCCATLRVQVADARPGAWALTARGRPATPTVRGELRELARRRGSGETPAPDRQGPAAVVVPAAVALVRATSSAPSRAFVTMLRHPAAVIDSKQRWYGGWQGDVGRARRLDQPDASTSSAPRAASRRAFVRYEDLLERLDARGRPRRRAARPRRRCATPRRPRCAARTSSSTAASAARAPTGRASRSRTPLREQADELWELAQRLADAATATARARAARRAARRLRRALRRGRGDRAVLDRGRAGAARRRRRPRPPAAARALAARVPDPLRRRIPVAVKASVYRRLSA